MNRMMIRLFILHISVLIVLSGVVFAGDSEQAQSNAIEVQEPVRVSDIEINVTDPWQPVEKWVKIARTLIYIKTGDIFSEKKLETSLKALKLSNVFQEIHVDSEAVAGGMRLVFSLKPFQLIKDIHIQNNYPIFKRNLFNTLQINVGDVYARPVIEAQKKLIAEQYRLRGYVDPQVDIRAAQDPSDGHYNLDILIEKGDYYTLERLNLRGNKVFSDTTLKQQMKIWQLSRLSGRTGRFEFRQAEEDIKRLIQFYRKKKYAEVNIRHNVKIKPEKKTVYVNATVDEGPRYELIIEGNKAFSRLRMRKDIVLFSAGNRGDAGLRKTIRNIRNRYRKAGFAEVEVEASDEILLQESGELRKLVITIREGPKTLVEKVDIRDNTVLDDQKIKKQMLTHDPGFFGKGAFSQTVLDDDLFMIQNLYASEGYHETTVTPAVTFNEDRSLATVVVQVDEGVQTRVGKVDFAGPSVLPEAQLRKAVTMESGAPFQLTQVKADENAVASLFSEAGYPHIRVSTNVEYSEDRTLGHVTFRIEQGPQVHMGEIFYSGNFRTKEHIVARELEMEPGEPFSPRKLLEGQKQIRDMNIFDSVQLKSIGLKDKTDTVNLFVELEEKKPYFTELAAGYQTDRGFYGRAKAGDHNLFGLNKDLWIEGEVSEIGYRVESVLSEPRFLGTKVSYDLSVFTEKIAEFNQNFGTKSFGTSLNFSREIYKDLEGGLGFRFERRQQFRANGEEIPDNELEPRSILVTSPSLGYDTRDSFIRPRKGLYSDFIVDISRGIENSLDDFTKYRLDLRFYTTPLKRLTFAFLGRGGYIRPFGDDANVPSDQLFFLGGTNNVRGFDENLLRFDENGNAVGGRQAVSGSIEGRIDLWYNFEFTVFADAGSVMDVPDSDGSDEIRSSAGMGLRYHTPIGPIGFLYGWKLDPKPDEDPGRLHFTIGYTF